MTSRPLVSHASTILDRVSMRAASANAWTGVQALSVVFVAVLTAAAVWPISSVSARDQTT